MTPSDRSQGRLVQPSPLLNLIDEAAAGSRFAGLHGEHCKHELRLFVFLLFPVSKATVLGYCPFNQSALMQLGKKTFQEAQGKVSFGVRVFKRHLQHFHFRDGLIAHAVRPLVGVSESSGGDSLAFPPKGRPSGEVAA